MPRTRIAITTSDWELLAEAVTPEVRDGVLQLDRESHFPRPIRSRSGSIPNR
jgi:hypothetical protein